jgi:hypothetical protein
MLNFVSDRASRAGARHGSPRYGPRSVTLQLQLFTIIEESCSRRTPLDLLKLLPRLLPAATAWVQAQEAKILASGRPLSETETKLAVLVGVQHPKDIRISVVRNIPTPEDPELRSIAAATTLIGPNTGGITFGRGIYILEGQVTDRLVSHELRHVHQYETFGSIGAFLTTYLEQIATVGYDRAPLELDAQRHERGAL